MSEAILPIRVDDHYWIVADDESRLWSSARAAYVAPDDAAYAAWQSSGALMVKTKRAVSPGLAGTSAALRGRSRM